MWLSSELGGFDRGQGLVYANGSCSFFSTHFIIMIFRWIREGDLPENIDLLQKRYSLENGDRKKEYFFR